MKFFHINNSVCTHCDKCVRACPTSAIYTTGERKYINYDKCTSCGSCMKSCSMAGVTVRSLEDVVKESENIEIYRNRIRRLESELTGVNIKFAQSHRCLDGIIEALSVAAAVLTPEGEVSGGNRKFAEITAGGFEVGGSRESLKGYNILTSTGEETARLFRSVLPAPDRVVVTAEFQGRPMTVTFTPLSDRLTFCTIDDFSSVPITNMIIRDMIDRVIDSQMGMVQKIGSLLGEEASRQVSDLNTVLRILENRSKSDDQE